MHLADLHLGYQQYGLPERALDFVVALGRAVREALAIRPDFCLVAGDFFHHRQVDALTLRQAIAALEPLRDAGIPVLTVAGNHDLGWRDGSESWLTLLHHLGYLTYLDLDPRAESLLQPGPEGSGPVVETDGARVVGLPYLGASLPRVLARLSEELRALPRKYTILMLHAGLEGTIPGVTEPLRTEHLLALDGAVDYVALGHRHMPFEQSGHHPGIYNPGSLETAAADESEHPGGWFTVEVTQNAQGSWSQSAVHNVCPRRAFHRLSLDVGLCSTPPALHQAARRLAESLPAPGKRKPVVDLRLYGSLLFSPKALDLDRLTAELQEQTHALRLLVRNQTTPSQGPTAPGEGLTRAALEQEVLAQSIAQDHRYRHRARELAVLAAEVKQMALAGARDEEVFDQVAQAVENGDE